MRCLLAKTQPNIETSAEKMKNAKLKTFKTI